MPIAAGVVRLDPFVADAAQLDGLAEALAHPEVFAGGYGGGPAGLPAGRAAFDAWCRDYGTGPDALRYVVSLVGGPLHGRVVGATTLGDLDEDAGFAHIGWTGYDPRVWGTAVNPATKLALLSLAFEHGYRHVRLQADEANHRSRAAIERLGARFVELRERDRVRADGTVAGTAVYAVLAEDWPAVEAGLLARLAAWGDRPVVLKPWPEVTGIGGRVLRPAP